MNISVRRVLLFLVAAVTVALIAAPRPAAADAISYSFFFSIADNCLVCDLMREILDKSELLKSEVFGAFRTAFSTLLGFALALWLLLQGAKMLLPLGPLSQGGVVPAEIFKRLSFGMIAVALLATGGDNANDNFFVAGVVNPFVDGALNLTQSSLEIVSEKVVGDADLISSLCRPLNNNTVSDSTPPLFNQGNSAEAQRLERWENLYCYAFAAQRTYGSMMSLGMAVMNHVLKTIDESWTNSDDPSATMFSEGARQTILNPPDAGSASYAEPRGNQSFFDNLGRVFGTLDGPAVPNDITANLGMIYGFTIFGLYFFLFARFLFILLEFVFRLALMVAISPALITAFVFPSLRKASTAGLSGLFTSAVRLWLNIMVLVLGIYIMYVMVKSAFPPGTPNLNDVAAYSTPSGGLPTIPHVVSYALKAIKDSLTTDITFFEINKAFIIFLLGGLFTIYMARLASKLSEEVIRAAEQATVYAVSQGGLGAAASRITSAITSITRREGGDAAGRVTVETNPIVGGGGGANVSRDSLVYKETGSSYTRELERKESKDGAANKRPGGDKLQPQIAPSAAAGHGGGQAAPSVSSSSAPVNLTSNKADAKSQSSAQANSTVQQAKGSNAKSQSSQGTRQVGGVKASQKVEAGPAKSGGPAAQSKESAAAPKGDVVEGLRASSSNSAPAAKSQKTVNELLRPSGGGGQQAGAPVGVAVQKSTSTSYATNTAKTQRFGSDDRTSKQGGDGGVSGGQQTGQTGQVGQQDLATGQNDGSAGDKRNSAAPIQQHDAHDNDLEGKRQRRMQEVSDKDPDISLTDKSINDPDSGYEE